MAPKTFLYSFPLFQFHFSAGQDAARAGHWFPVSDIRFHSPLLCFHLSRSQNEPSRQCIIKLGSALDLHPNFSTDGPFSQSSTVDPRRQCKPGRICFNGNRIPLPEIIYRFFHKSCQAIQISMA